MPVPPRPPQRPHDLVHHGDRRVDPYYWLGEREPDVLEHLAAENAYLHQTLAPLAPLTEEIYGEIRARVKETDHTVPVRHGDWWYFERTREGLDYPVTCRVAARADDPTPPPVDPVNPAPGEQVVLDENDEARGHDFLAVGVFAVSPDDRWVAVGVDVEGDERHTLTFRPLAGQAPLADEIRDVYYGFAWANDARHVWYTRVDDAMRPWQVWRHEIAAPPESDVLVYQEDDAQFTVSVGRSRDGRVILVHASSSTTSEWWFLPADDATAAPRLLERRRAGIDDGVEHYVDPSGHEWWLKVTNEGATDFRLLARRTHESSWRELVAERPGSRLDGVDAFAHYLALSERHDGSAALRVIPLPDGDQAFDEDLLARSYLVEGDAFPSTVSLSTNLEYASDFLRVSLTSLVTPRQTADVRVGTGEVLVRQQLPVHGYDRDQYVTGRLWVTASDGELIPVSIVTRADQATLDERGELVPTRDAPLLLYGYGSYEIAIDPSFSSLRLSLLERGVTYAIAHVRGGGERGRAWYEMGRLAQKPTSFSDFVRVGRALVERGWTTPSRLAARGGSAGGLLMGAAMNLAPDLWRAVVAEVPFVDALTTMLDASLPLTIGEWEEWGDPAASATTYRTMRAYSPYDNVRATDDDGSPRRYPRLLATGGLHDSRVGYWEPAKWVLALRDANPDNVALLKTDMGAGHGGPSGRYDSWRDEAQIIAFLLDSLDVATSPRSAG